jgi:hypothetical protein
MQAPVFLVEDPLAAEIVLARRQIGGWLAQWQREVCGFIAALEHLADRGAFGHSALLVIVGNGEIPLQRVGQLHLDLRKFGFLHLERAQMLLAILVPQRDLMRAGFGADIDRVVTDRIHGRVALAVNAALAGRDAGPTRDASLRGCDHTRRGCATCAECRCHADRTIESA